MIVRCEKAQAFADSSVTAGAFDPDNEICQGCISREECRDEAENGGGKEVQEA